MDIEGEDDGFERIPGLYLAWDFGLLLEEGRSYRIEEGGRTDDGQALFVVFVRMAAASGRRRTI